VRLSKGEGGGSVERSFWLNRAVEDPLEHRNVRLDVAPQPHVAASRWSVLSTHSRFVVTKSRLNRRMLSEDGGRFLNKWLRPSGGIVLAHSMSIASASSLTTIPTTAIAWQAT
jgi:hypothetical protein